MPERKKFAPEEKNLGKPCMFWDIHGRHVGCNYLKLEMEGRTSCEGIVDQMCLCLKDGRRPVGVSEEVLMRLRTRIPSFGPKTYIPASRTTKK